MPQIVTSSKASANMKMASYTRMLTCSRSRRLQVVAPYPNSPADKAGIRPLDRLLAIGDRSTQGMSLYEAGELLQGADGSEVGAPAHHRHTAPLLTDLPPCLAAWCFILFC